MINLLNQGGLYAKTIQRISSEKSKPAIFTPKLAIIKTVKHITKSCAMCTRRRKHLVLVYSHTPLQISQVQSRSNISLAKEKRTQVFELSFVKRFCENIGLLFPGTNMVYLYSATLDIFSEVVIFDCNVFCTQSEPCRLVNNNATYVIFK